MDLTTKRVGSMVAIASISMHITPTVSWMNHLILEISVAKEVHITLKRAGSMVAIVLNSMHSIPTVS